MEDKNFTISTHKLSNHCPECYSGDGMLLTFRQGFKETPFYKAITKAISFDIHCQTCDSKIYPIRWTDDLEQVVAYHQRGLKPKPPSLKLKKLTWVLLIIAIILIAVMAVSYFNDTDVIDLG